MIFGFVTYLNKDKRIGLRKKRFILLNLRQFDNHYRA